MTKARSRTALLALLLSVACDQADSKNTAPRESSEEIARPPKPQGIHLSTTTAFELIAGGTGATLVYAPSERARGALLKVQLDHKGAPLGAPVELSGSRQLEGKVSDLTATWAKDQLTVAWIARQQGEPRVHALQYGPKLQPRVLDLGRAWLAPPGARGNLALAAQGQSALLAARGGPSRCPEKTRRRCFDFSFYRLRSAHAQPTGLPLTVPVPCSENSIRLAVVGRTLHYGVCTGDETGAVTTLFTIQNDPEYARADPLLPGCRPLSLVELDGVSWLIADCKGQRRAARVGALNGPIQTTELSAVSLKCEAGRAHLSPGARELELQLDSPRGDLQALLPRSIASEESRAVWTGSALVVAWSQGDQLKLTRYRCDKDVLRQLADAETE